MELILLQAGKENQEQSAAEDFERSDSLSGIWKANEQLGMNEPRLSELSAVRKEAAKEKAQRILGTTESTSGIS